MKSIASSSRRPGTVTQLPHGVPRRPAAGVRAMDGFRQPHPRHHRRRHGDRRRRPDRRGEADMRKRRTERRTDDEAEAERGAEDAVRLGAILFFRDVGDVGASRGDVAARQAVHDPRGEQHRQALRDGEHGEAHRGADQAEDENRPAAPAVRELAEQRRGDELRQRERGEQQADDERGGAEGAGVERQQRNDDSEADQVDEDRKENYQQWSGHAAIGYWITRTPLMTTGSIGTSSCGPERCLGTAAMRSQTSIPLRTRPKTA